MPMVNRQTSDQHNPGEDLFTSPTSTVLGPKPWVFLALGAAVVAGGVLIGGTNRVAFIAIAGALGVIGLAQLLWTSATTRKLARSTAALADFTAKLATCEDASQAAEAGLHTARSLCRPEIKIGVGINVGGSTVSLGEPLSGMQTILGSEAVHLTIVGSPNEHEAWCLSQIAKILGLALTSVHQRTSTQRATANWKALAGANAEVGLMLDSEGQITKATPNARQIFGGDVIGRCITDLLPVGVLALTDAVFNDPNDVHRSIRVSYQSAADKSYVATLADATEEIRAQRIDVDTGLANLADFGEMRAIDQSTLLMVSADHYGRVMQAAGLESAQKILAILAVRLQEHFRSGIDQIWRGPGSTFLVLSPGAANDPEWVESKRLTLSAPATVGDSTVAMPITVAMVPIATPTSCAEVLRFAEVTLEFARQSATERVVTFTKELQIRAEREYRLSSDLASGADRLDSIGLSVHYQPIVDAFDGRVRAVEGLARWNHPKLGPVGPDEFIKVAERAGLVEGIDRFVLETAIADAPKLRRSEPKLGIQVNLSPVGLTPARVREVANRIESSLGRNSMITVEIIESAIGEDSLTGILGALGDMRSAGVGVSLDDFGVGESNFSRLARLPLTQVKLADVFTTEVSPALAAGVISTIHNMGLECVVEGVETIPQADQMQAAGADSIQGWLFARAAPVDEAAEFIRIRNQNAMSGRGAPNKTAANKLR